MLVSKRVSVPVGVIDGVLVGFIVGVLLGKLLLVGDMGGAEDSGHSYAQPTINGVFAEPNSVPTAYLNK